MEVTFSVLCFHPVKVDATCIYSYRSSRFHSAVCDSVTGDGFSQLVRSRLGHSSSRQLMTSDMHKPVEESSCGQYNAFCLEGNSPNCDQAGHFSVFYQKFADGILLNMEIGCIFQSLPPRPDKFGTIALRSRTPHGRTF